jgi:hypothetical protein
MNNPHLKLYSILTDEGRILCRTTFPKALYLMTALQDSGIQIESEEPWPTQLPTSFFADQQYDMSINVTIVNPDDESSLYVLNGRTQLFLAAMAAYLSKIFTRHGIELRKDDEVLMHFINGQVFVN